METKIMRKLYDKKITNFEFYQLADLRSGKGDLKKCPHCGTQYQSFFCFFRFETEHDKRCGILCRMCGAKGPEIFIRSEDGIPEEEIAWEEKARFAWDYRYPEKKVVMLEDMDRELRY